MCIKTDMPLRGNAVCSYMPTVKKKNDRRHRTKIQSNSSRDAILFSVFLILFSVKMPVRGVRATSK
jgi:hypothetical protein